MQLKSNTALLLIDLQQGFNESSFFGTERNNPQAEQNATNLLNCWRKQQLPIFHIQHCSTNLDSPLREGHSGHNFVVGLEPKANEPLFKKTVNSSFIETNLKTELDKFAITDLVIVGLTTEHCVSTTTRMAANYGYNCFLVSDATAAFDKTICSKHFSAEIIHQTSLATLDKEFAKIIDTQTILDLF